MTKEEKLDWLCRLRSEVKICLNFPIDWRKKFEETLSDVIDGLLRSDAVKVVRCRDCKYWDTVSGSTFAPTHHQCKVIKLMSTGTWYCASGERKDGKDENGRTD